MPSILQHARRRDARATFAREGFAAIGRAPRQQSAGIEQHGSLHRTTQARVCAPAQAQMKHQLPRLRPLAFIYIVSQPPRPWNSCAWKRCTQSKPPEGAQSGRSLDPEAAPSAPSRCVRSLVSKAHLKPGAQRPRRTRLESRLSLRRSWPSPYNPPWAPAANATAAIYPSLTISSCPVEAAPLGPAPGPCRVEALMFFDIGVTGGHGTRASRMNCCIARGGPDGQRINSYLG